ncbi:MAG: ketopantoate reductase C-terminal domain-containing protein, partial [Verrucomicrobiota bacterium]
MLPGRIFIGEFFGSYRERTMQVVQCFERAGIVCYFSKSLDESLWRKLVWNIPFNGLTIAAGGIDTQQLLQGEGAEQLVRLLMQEVQQAALAYGHDIPFAFLDEQVEETLTMGPYKPSSLIDFLAGREVEVEAIFGEPLRRGQAKGIAMPHLETLYLLLKSLCSGAALTKIS